MPNVSSSSQLAIMESIQNQHGTKGITQNSLSFFQESREARF
jgi:hypothetical protein